MTGAEHYREAERLLAIPADDHEACRNLHAEAQVHATLALAAATAYSAVKDYYGDEASDARDWARVTS